METLFQLGVVLSLKDRISDGLKNISAIGDEAIAKMGSLRNAVMGVSIAVVALAAAWVSMGNALADTAGKFEYQVAAAGLIAQASPAEEALMSAASIQAGIETQFSPTEAAAGLQTLAANGNDARTSIAMLNPVLDLAAASMQQLSVADAGGVVSQSLKAFQLDTSDSTRVVDELVRSTNMFALQFKDLPLALGIASRGAQTFKQSFEETLASVGLVKNIIPTVERSSTAVAVAMERLATPKAQRQLERYVSVVDQSTGKFRPFLDILNDLVAATAKMSDQKRAGFLIKAFGAEAMGGISAIMTQLSAGIKDTNGSLLKGADAIAYLRGRINEAGGAAANFRERLLSTYEGVKILWQGSVETLSIQVGAAFGRILKPIRELMLLGLNKLIDWWSKLNPKMQEFIVLAPAIAGGLAAIVLGIAGIIAIMPILNTLLVGTPVGWVTLAIVGLGAAIAALIIYWDQLKATFAQNSELTEVNNAFKNLYDVLSIAALMLVRWNKFLWGTVFAGIINILAEILLWIARFVIAVRRKWEELFKGIAKIFDAIGAAARVNFRDLLRAFGLSSLQARIWSDRIVMAIEAVIGAIKRLIDITTWINPVTAGIKLAYRLTSSDNPTLTSSGSDARNELSNEFDKLFGASSSKPRLSQSIMDLLNPGAQPQLGPTNTSASQRLSDYGGASAASAGAVAEKQVHLNFYGNFLVQAKDVLEAQKVEDVMADAFLKAARA